MYFYTKKGEQCIDFTGNLIITHNDALVKTRNKSAGPRHCFHNTYIHVHGATGPILMDGQQVIIKPLTLWRKWAALYRCYQFIFGPSQALINPEDIPNE
jgi:hypothetical protein